MPKKRVIDLDEAVAVGSDFLLAANDRDTFITKISDIPIETTKVKTTHSSHGRTVGARFEDIVNIKDFGAIGDGFADDTRAFKDALDDIVALNKTVFIPNGVYSISDTITLPTTARIVGYNATIKQITQNTTIFKRTSIIDKQINNLIIEGITFRGYGIGDTASTKEIDTYTTDAHAVGIWLEGATNCVIQHCTFENFKNAGVIVSNGQNVTVNNNTITGTRPDVSVSDRDSTEIQYGIWFYSTIEPYTNNCIVQDNIIKNVNQGIRFDEGYTNTLIDSNILTNIGVDGVTVCPASNLTISNNQIDAKLHGVYVNHTTLQFDTPPEYIRVVGNKITTSVVGIRVQVFTEVAANLYSIYYLDHVEISENIISHIQNIYSFNSVGIDVRLSKSVNIHNNTLRDIDGKGVSLENCDGVIDSNILQQVEHENIDVQLSPTGIVHIHNNVSIDSGKASLAYYFIRSSVIPTEWLSGTRYQTGSYVRVTDGSNIRIYSCTSGNDIGTTAPSGESVFHGNNLVWEYIGRDYNYNKGEVNLTRNCVTASSRGTPDNSMWVESGLRFKWSYNILPNKQITTDVSTNGDALQVLVYAVIVSEVNNIFGGYALDKDGITYTYAPFSPGQNSRDFINSVVHQGGDGVWQLSDRVWNSLPAAGESVGWICVSAGDPGQWVPFGYLGLSGSAANFPAPLSGNNATSNQVVLGSDTRLTNDRTPTSHTHTHNITGSDPVTPTDIGALSIENCLGELPNIALARTNLELGTFAVYNVPTPLPVTDKFLSYNASLQTLEWVAPDKTTVSNKYATTFGNGLCSEYIIQHDLNSTDLFVQVYDITTTPDTLISLPFTYKYNSSRSIQLNFNTIILDLQCRVLILT